MGLRIPYKEMKRIIEKALLAAGVPAEKAAVCAEIHTDSSADGIESHGLNRVPRFIDYVKKGLVNVNTEPEIVSARGAVERIDGHRGIGITSVNRTCQDDVCHTNVIGYVYKPIFVYIGSFHDKTFRCIA